MSIITDISPQQAAHQITEGIKAQIANHIEDELRQYLAPLIKMIAKQQAESVCREAVFRMDRDVTTDQINVSVVFREQSNG